MINPFIDQANPEAALLRDLAPAETEEALIALSGARGPCQMHLVPPHGASCADGPHGWLFCVHPEGRPDVMFQARTFAGAIGLALLGLTAQNEAALTEQLGVDLARIVLSPHDYAFDPESGCVVPLLDPPEVP